MDRSPVLAVLILAAILFAGCTQPIAQKGTISISSTIPAYSPEMSSAVGLDLVPHYTGPESGSLQFHWTTGYGSFVDWSAPYYKVIPLGNNTFTRDQTVYWTYMPATPGEEPSSVVISLSVEDPVTGSVLAKNETVLVRGDTGYRVGG